MTYIMSMLQVYGEFRLVKNKLCCRTVRMALKVKLTPGYECILSCISFAIWNEMGLMELHTHADVAVDQSLMCVMLLSGCAFH